MLNVLCPALLTLDSRASYVGRRGRSSTHPVLHEHFKSPPRRRFSPFKQVPPPAVGLWSLVFGLSCATRPHASPIEDGLAQGGAAGPRPEGRG